MVHLSLLMHGTTGLRTTPTGASIALTATRKDAAVTNLDVVKVVFF